MGGGGTTTSGVLLATWGLAGFFGGMPETDTADDGCNAHVPMGMFPSPAVRGSGGLRPGEASLRMSEGKKRAEGTARPACLSAAAWPP